MTVKQKGFFLACLQPPELMKQTNKEHTETQYWCVYERRKQVITEVKDIKDHHIVFRTSKL